MRVGYLQCVGGVSGDMLLGAIVDAGVPLDELRSRLGGLAFSGFTISARRDRRAGVEGTLVSVEPGSSPGFATVTDLVDARGLLRSGTVDSGPERGRSWSGWVMRKLPYTETRTPTSTSLEARTRSSMWWGR